MKNKNFKRILIMNPYGLGDVLFTTPVIKFLRQNFPDAYIAYMCNSRVESIFQNNELIDEVIVFEKKLMTRKLGRSIIDIFKKGCSFASFVRKKKFDLSIDYSLNFQFSLFTMLIGIKERIGLDYKKRSIFLTKRIVFEGFEDRHVVEYYVSVLELIGISPKFCSLGMELGRAELVRATEILKNEGIYLDKHTCIAICPAGGESWGRDAWRKHWQADKFAKLADRIIKEFGAKVIIFAAQDEATIGNEVSNLMEEEAINLSGKTNTIDFLALLSKCKILVTNDGGPLHVGVVLGVKTVSIFGPVSDVTYGPYSANYKKHIVVKKDLFCRPCYKKFRIAKCLNDQKCLKDITVDEVFNSVKKLDQIN